MVSLPLQSLSTDEQMLIFKKMHNVGVIRTMMTCNSMKNFIHNHSREFSSRPHYGDDFCVMDNGNTIFVENNCKRVYITYNSDFALKLAPISIKRMKIGIMRDNTIVAVLKEWKPVCAKVEIIGFHSSSVLFDLIDNIKCTNFTFIHGRLFGDFQWALNVLREKRLNICDITNVRSGGTTIEILKHSNQVKFYTDAGSMNGFFLALLSLNDHGHLELVTFELPPYTVKYPYLPLNTGSPTTTVLYSIPAQEAISKEKNPVSIRKLNLGNGFCVIIEEIFNFSQFSSSITIRGRFVKNNDEQVLDLLFDLLKIKEVYRTEHYRSKYLSMNDEFRTTYLKTLGHSFNK